MFISNGFELKVAPAYGSCDCTVKARTARFAFQLVVNVILSRRVDIIQPEILSWCTKVKVFVPSIICTKVQNIGVFYSHPEITRACAADNSFISF